MRDALKRPRAACRCQRSRALSEVAAAESFRSIDSSGLSLLATWESQAGFGVEPEQFIGACFVMAVASVHHILIIIKTVSINIHT